MGRGFGAFFDHFLNSLLREVNSSSAIGFLLSQQEFLFRNGSSSSSKRNAFRNRISETVSLPYLCSSHPIAIAMD
jgi:hypothetical protein